MGLELPGPAQEDESVDDPVHVNTPSFTVARIG